MLHLGGKPPLSVNLRAAIESYLQENSNIASNRLMKNTAPLSENYKKIVPARYLIDKKKSFTILFHEKMKYQCQHFLNI